MSKVGEVLLEEGRAILVEKVKSIIGRNALDEAFAAWLLLEQIEGLNIQRCAHLATNHIGAERSYQDIAILGFTSAARLLEPDQQHALSIGLHWLAGREPFLDNFPMSFCMDAVALLGIALGVKGIAEEAARRAIADWMGKFMIVSYKGLQGWQKCLLAVAQREVGAVPDLRIPDEPAIADIRTALLSKGLLLGGTTEDDEYQTLMLVKTDSHEKCIPALAILRLAAFDWVRRATPVIVPSRITSSQVAELLRHVPFALRRWTWEDEPRTSRRGVLARKWYIDNEYHVQNLLWTILAPIFPDLKDEEYVPSFGPLHPRTDICIPSLKLIIEVKFMRAKMRPQSLIEEIAADANLYLANNSPYKNIIVFIWDDTRRSEQHDFIIQGLLQLEGVLDAIVVSRPGIMVGEYSED